KRHSAAGCAYHRQIWSKSRVVLQQLPQCLDHHSRCSMQAACLAVICRKICQTGIVDLPGCFTSAMVHREAFDWRDAVLGLQQRVQGLFQAEPKGTDHPAATTATLAGVFFTLEAL